MARWKVWREVYAGEVLAADHGNAMLAAIRDFGDEVCRVQSVASWEIEEEQRRLEQRAKAANDDD